MAKVVISYSRENDRIARNVARDIEAIGHAVWFDKELSGGQVWWDQILATIRDCDVFALILSPESLNSAACRREYSYAADLGKPILPVMVSEGVSINLLPPALSKLQYIDYLKQDRDAALGLARALTSVPPPPPPPPLPDPLPTPPEAPVSYLGNLTEQIETARALSMEEQSALVLDLKRSLRDADSADDARSLLKKLRTRPELFAIIGDEIDELLASTRPTPSVSTQAPEPKLPPREAPSVVPNIESVPGTTQPVTGQSQPPSQTETETPSTRQQPRRRWFRWTIAIVITYLSSVAAWSAAVGVTQQVPTSSAPTILFLILAVGFVLAQVVLRAPKPQPPSPSRTEVSQTIVEPRQGWYRLSLAIGLPIVVALSSVVVGLSFFLLFDAFDVTPAFNYLLDSTQGDIGYRIGFIFFNEAVAPGWAIAGSFFTLVVGLVLRRRVFSGSRFG